MTWAAWLGPLPLPRTPSPACSGVSRASVPLGSPAAAARGSEGGAGTPAAPPPAAWSGQGPLPSSGWSTTWMRPRVPDENHITEKYRIWMESREAERAPAPLSVSPPAGSRGLWEGRAEVASAKVPPAGWCRLAEVGETHAAFCSRSAFLRLGPCDHSAHRDFMFLVPSLASGA